MAAAYRIRNWKENFEVSQSLRIVGPLAWVGVPTKHDGKSFRRMIRQPNGPALFGCWCLIVQIAAKCPVRGVLADSDGPLTAEDMDEKTGCPASLFSETIQLLCSKQINWIEEVNFSEIQERPPPALREPSERSPDREPTEPDRPDRTGQITGAGLGGDFMNKTGTGSGTGKTPVKLRPLDKIRPEHIVSESALELLWHALNKSAPGFLLPGDDGFLQLIGASVRALEVSKTPIRLFVSIIRDERWDLIDDSQKAKAKERLVAYRKWKEKRESKPEPLPERTTS